MEIGFGDVLADTEQITDGIFGADDELQQSENQREPTNDNDVCHGAEKKGSKKAGKPLNEDQICSKVGLSALVNIFEGVVFNGKDEEENLGQLLKKFEYWAHQMYPRYSFQDVIEKVEELGSKKKVKQHAYAVKLGQVIHNEGKENKNLIEDINDGDQDVRLETDLAEMQ